MNVCKLCGGNEKSRSVVCAVCLVKWRKEWGEKAELALLRKIKRWVKRRECYPVWVKGVPLNEMVSEDERKHILEYLGQQEAKLKQSKR